MTKQRRVMKRIATVLTIVTILAALTIPASATPAPDEIAIPSGQTAFSIDITANLPAAYAGIEFALTISNENALTFASFTPKLSGASAAPFTTSDGLHYFGFYASSNAFPAGSSMVGTLNFTGYSGNQEITVNIVQMNVSRLDSNNKTNTTVNDSPAVFTITRNSGDSGDSGGPGGTTDTGSLGGITVIETEETPLEGLSSFAAFIEGYPDGTFRGSKNMTRQEFVTILSKIKNPDGVPVADPAAPSFNDVAPGRWSYDAIEWAVEAGAVDAGGNFRPSDPITRAEVSEMYAKADKLADIAENIFSDIDDHPARDYILMCVGQNIFEGYPDGTFKPDNPITRYEVVTSLVRYLLGGDPTDAMCEGIVFKLVDVPRSHWAYRHVVLATAGYTAS